MVLQSQRSIDRATSKFLLFTDSQVCFDVIAVGVTIEIIKEEGNSSMIPIVHAPPDKHLSQP